ncbi:MAG TPA: SRPBCC domain-containing protein [Bacteroidia bacterium]|nr:SRPBCC domain-containing protein [Bacteroidia bacterium]
MKTDWSSFTLSLAVKSSMKTIYNAWSIPNEIEKWFLEKCIYSNTQHMQNTTSGCDYKWSWYLYEIVESGKIMQANGLDFFQFTFAGNCIVDIQLEAMGEYTIIKLTQHNIPTDEASKFNIRIGCLEGWTFYLTNLKSFYENGHDLRNKIPELKGFNN